MIRAALREQRKAPVRFPSMILFQTASSASTTEAVMRFIPTLLIRMSRPPKRSRAASKSASTSPRGDMGRDGVEPLAAAEFLHSGREVLLLPAADDDLRSLGEEVPGQLQADPPAPPVTMTTFSARHRKCRSLLPSLLFHCRIPAAFSHRRS